MAQDRQTTEFMEVTSSRARILETVIRKSTLKQHVFDNTFAAFNLLKETLLEMASELDDQLEGRLDRRVRIEYRDRGKFEAQLQVANDLLIFQMHTDVFDFDDIQNAMDKSIADKANIVKAVVKIAK